MTTNRAAEPRDCWVATLSTMISAMSIQLITEDCAGRARYSFGRKEGKRVTSDYHPFVPPMGKARYFGLTHSQVLDSRPLQRVEGWQARLESLRAAPFRGITVDGEVVPSL